MMLMSILVLKNHYFSKIPVKIWNLILGKWVPIDTSVEYKKQETSPQEDDTKKKVQKKKSKGKKLNCRMGKLYTVERNE